MTTQCLFLSLKLAAKNLSEEATTLTSLTSLLNRITSPQLRGVPALYINSFFHSLIHSSFTLSVIYVSWRHITSYFLCLKKLNALFRVILDLSPLTFNEKTFSPLAIRRVHYSRVVRCPSVHALGTRGQLVRATLSSGFGESPSSRTRLALSDRGCAGNGKVV